MSIKRYQPNAERSARVQPLGKIFKGSERKKVWSRQLNKEVLSAGTNLDYFRFVPHGASSDRLQEVWDQYYAFDPENPPKEINIFFKHDNIDQLIDDWYSEFATGGLLKTKCDGETITEWRDDRGQYHLNRPKPCREPNNPKGCELCKASALIKFGIPEFRYMGYSGNFELSTTSVNDIVFLKAQLAEIAAELALCNASLKYAPLILSRSPRVITKTYGNQSKRGEENLLYLSISPDYQMQIDRAISAAKYAEIGASYEPQKMANAPERLALPRAITVEAETIPPFWKKFKELCDKCKSDEQFQAIGQWLQQKNILRDFPQEEGAIAEELAKVKNSLIDLDF